jgi:hypothetical protein
MPTKCDECGKPSYCIYITREYKNLCGECYDKTNPVRTDEPEDLSYRVKRI